MNARSSAVEGSVQWRSSKTRITGPWALNAASASTSSWNERACVAPLVRRCSSANRAALTSPGICASQVGACSVNTSMARAPPRPRHNVPMASSTGRKACPVPYCSTHEERPTSDPLVPAVSTNASTSVVLPTPASPVTKTVVRRWSRADRRAACRALISCSRPTTRLAIVSAGDSSWPTDPRSSAYSCLTSADEAIAPPHHGLDDTSPRAPRRS